MSSGSWGIGQKWNNKLGIKANLHSALLTAEPSASPSSPPVDLTSSNDRSYSTTTADASSPAESCLTQVSLLSLSFLSVFFWSTVSFSFTPRLSSPTAFVFPLAHPHPHSVCRSPALTSSSSFLACGSGSSSGQTTSPACLCMSSTPLSLSFSLALSFPVNNPPPSHHYAGSARLVFDNKNKKYMFVWFKSLISPGISTYKNVQQQHTYIYVCILRYFNTFI